MLPLAGALARAGHEVCWAVAEQVCAALRRDGFEAVPAGVDDLVPSPFANTAAGGCRAPAGRASEPPVALNFGPLRVRPMLADPPAHRRARPPPRARLRAGGAGRTRRSGRLRSPSVTHAFGRLLPEARVARAGEALEGVYREHGLAPRPTPERTTTSTWTSTRPACRAARSRTSGRCSACARLRRPRDPAAAPLIYVTLGTVFIDDQALFGAADEAARGLGIRVVVTVGPGTDPRCSARSPGRRPSRRSSRMRSCCPPARPSSRTLCRNRWV
jgi:UDP:flavonoid glycosyltransferase YjiC (YdhE family)